MQWKYLYETRRTMPREIHFRVKRAIAHRSVKALAKVKHKDGLHCIPLYVLGF